VDKIIKIKMAAYFFCVVGSPSLCAMELELQKSNEYCEVQRTWLCTEIMKKYEVPQDVACIIRSKIYSPRMDTIYKKFDPFFHFNAAGYRCMKAYKPKIPRIILAVDYAYYSKLETDFFKTLNCRKFFAVKPRTLFYFTDNQDEILLSLISSPNCFIHVRGDCRIALTKNEREKYLMLPAEFRDVLSQYLLGTAI
jgi:hypothetical protein